MVSALCLGTMRLFFYMKSLPLIAKTVFLSLTVILVRNEYVFAANNALLSIMTIVLGAKNVCPSVHNEDMLVQEDMISIGHADIILFCESYLCFLRTLYVCPCKLHS